MDKTKHKIDGYFTTWDIGLDNPEQCLLATKGKPKRISKSVKQLVFSKRQEHSKKPDIIRDNIVDYGDLPRIELFVTKGKRLAQLGRSLLNANLSEKKYNIIYTDPPYSFNSPKYQDRNRGFGNRVEDRYKTMSIKDICNLPVKNLTNDDALLFMWVVDI